MEFEGILYRILAPVTGTSARGNWTKQEVVFELPGEFNRKVCVSFWGDKVQDVATLREGDRVQVSANVESREYNGRWFTEVRAWKLARVTATGAVSGATSESAAGSRGMASNLPPLNLGAEETSAARNTADEVDDLPF